MESRHFSLPADDIGCKLSLYLNLDLILYDYMMVIRKDLFFESSIKKIMQTTKNHEKFPSIQRVKIKD